MSSLINSFLIDPVVRQARRLSRSSNPGDSGTPQLQRPSSSHESLASVSDGQSIPDRPREMDSDHDAGYAPLRDGQGAPTGCVGTISGQSMVESPVVEADDPLDAELRTLHGRRIPPSTQSASSASRQRTSSLHFGNASLDRSQADYETSGNPSYGIPDPFVTRNPSVTPSFSTSSSIIDGIMSSSAGPSRSNTGGAPLQAPDRNQNAILPEDDGMAALRQQIIEIRDMEVSSVDKARLMHQLMMGQYESSQIKLVPSLMLRPHSPASMQGLDQPSTPTSANFVNHTQGPLTPTSMTSRDLADETTFNLSAEDLEPTYVPIPPTVVGASRSEALAPTSSGDVEPTPSLGCMHYKRNVKLQCSACRKWYSCRFCHDEAESHALNRKATKHMLCMLCGCAQVAGERCKDCGVRGAWYYCDICKLWDDDNEKSIYHCNDCGICRLGQGLGKDFYHCKTCNVCMSISIADSHRHIERSTDCDCPICGEYMFTSPETVVFMICGHSIHQKCYYAHMKSSYRCPICSRSVVNMEFQFRNLDRSIENQPMPPQFQDTKAMVYCNDCRAKSVVKYHWLGLKCAICDSYNTAQGQILTDTDTSPTDEQADEVVAPPPPSDLDVSRGRNSISRGSGPGTRTSSPHLRRLTSTSATDNAIPPLYAIAPRRSGRSASPFRDTLPSHTEADWPAVLGDDHEEDDVDFWGGESPLSQKTPRPAAADEDLEVIDAEFSDEDYEMADKEEEEEDDDDDDGDEFMPMDLPGHR